MQMRILAWFTRYTLSVVLIRAQCIIIHACSTSDINDVMEIPTVIIAFQCVTDIRTMHSKTVCRIRCLMLSRSVINDLGIYTCKLLVLNNQYHIKQAEWKCKVSVHTGVYIHLRGVAH